MSNRRFGRRPKFRLSAEGRKPVDAYTAGQLHRFLVEDGVQLHATDLPWAVKAYDRIGELHGCGAEEAYQRVRAEVRELSGHGMPVFSGAIIGGAMK